MRGQSPGALKRWGTVPIFSKQKVLFFPHLPNIHTLLIATLQFSYIFKLVIHKHIGDECK
jgi:hypothetical protein